MDLQQPGHGDLSSAPAVAAEPADEAALTRRPHHGLAVAGVHREARVPHARGNSYSSDDERACLNVFSVLSASYFRNLMSKFHQIVYLLPSTNRVGGSVAEWLACWTQAQ